MNKPQRPVIEIFIHLIMNPTFTTQVGWKIEYCSRL